MELYIIRHGQSTNNTLNDPRGRVCDPPLTELGQRQVALVAQHLASATSRAPWAADGHDRRGCGIARLYCSPMRRALETAQPIGRALEVVPEVWIDIHEFGGIYLDYGEPSGAPRDGAWSVRHYGEPSGAPRDGAWSVRHRGEPTGAPRDGAWSVRHYGEPTGVVAYPGKTRSEILAEFPHYRLPEGITEQGWWRGGREERAAFTERVARVAEVMRQWAADDERIAIVSHGDFSNGLLHALFRLAPERGVYYHHRNTAITRIDFQGDGHLDVQYVNRVEHLPAELIS